MERDIRFVDGAGKPEKHLLDEYVRMAAADDVPYYLICLSGHWVCKDYLDSERDQPAYYYIPPSGHVSYGANAELDAMNKGFGAARRPARASRIKRGKYGKMKHIPSGDNGAF